MADTKLEQFMDKYFLPMAQKLSEQKYLQAIRDGLILSIPFVIGGSIFLILGNLPIPGYADFMSGIFGEKWNIKLSYPITVTFDLVGLIASVGVAYNLAKSNKVEPLIAGMISLVSFLLVTPGKILIMDQTVSGFASSYLGGKGVFIAIICAIVSTEIYTWFIRKNLVIKMPDMVPPAVAKSFSALIPSIAILILFLIIKIGLESTPYEDIHKLITKIISDPLTGFSATLFGGIVFVLINSVFWTFGIHGGSMAGIAFNPMWAVIRDANIAAFQRGEAIPHIISQEFFFAYVFLGGSGATLCLVLGYLFFSKAKQYKEIGKLSIGSSFFNINEPIIFGSPVVLNPLLMLPFILAPLTLTLISYAAIKMGLVAPAFLTVPWTMPIIISGFLSTGGHISGVILQIVNLIVGFFIYFPFLKMLDKKTLLDEKRQSEEISETK